MIEQAMLIALKATLIFQAVFVFYFFGKDEKIPYSARDIFLVVANAGSLFLAAGLIKNNSFLIKGGIFIIVTQGLIDAHFLISRYLKNKSIEKEEEKSNAKK